MKIRPPAVCASAARVLEHLIEGLGVGESRTVGDPTGLRLAIVVERHEDEGGGSAYSVGQYHRAQGGGVIWDPRVTFERSPAGEWTPVSYEEAFTRIRDARLLSLEAGRKLTGLCNVWIVQIVAAGGRRTRRRRVAGCPAAPAHRGRLLESHSAVALPRACSKQFFAR